MSSRGRPGADLQTSVNRSVAWVGVASSLVGVLDTLAFFILVSFWISPAQLGVAVLATSLFPVLDQATDLGLTAAVIQRDDHTRDRVSTVFWLNLFMSLVMFLLLALVIGPIISAVQGQPVVKYLLAAYGFKLIWQNVYFIPYALMKRELRFKELSVLRIVANLAEFAGKIGFAWAGFGIWCFVLGPLCRVLVTGVGTQILNPWRPAMVLKVRDALDWTVFGLKTSASKILFHFYTNTDYQVVGYFFGSTANGLYNAAYRLVLEPAMVISDVINAVAFPVFSRLKHQRTELIEQLVRFTRQNLVVMLTFIGVVLVSTQPIFGVFELVRGGHWTDAVPAARILCVVAALRALSFLVPPLLDGMNRPTLTLRYTVVASIVLPALFVVSAATLGDRLGYVSVAVAWAVGYPIAFAVLFVMALTLLELPAVEFVRRIIGIPLCGAAAMLVSWAAARAAGSLPGAAQFVLASAVMIAGFFGLLARFQGITPRSVVRSLRGS